MLLVGGLEDRPDEALHQPGFGRLRWPGGLEHALPKRAGELELDVGGHAVGRGAVGPPEVPGKVERQPPPHPDLGDGQPLGRHRVGGHGGVHLRQAHGQRLDPVCSVEMEQGTRLYSRGTSASR